MTTAARGAHCRWGVEKKLSYYSSVTGGPIVLRFGMLFRKPIWYGVSSSPPVGWSSARVHVHTPSLPLRNGSADRVSNLLCGW